MKPLAKITLAFILSVSASAVAPAQILTSADKEYPSADSLRREFDKRPYFGLYKDNYFIFGPPLNRKPDKANTNVKFQISFMQRLTNNKFPGGAYLYLFYTQKVEWHVLEASLPMSDLSFNPGIGLAKPIFCKDKFLGKVCVQVEHESNGKDGECSRSWNKISFGANVLILDNLMVHAKFWIPIIDGGQNRDILDYCGIYQDGVQFKTPNERWRFGVTFVKLCGWNLKHNVITDVQYFFSKKADWGLYAQLYSGYGENLLEYKAYKCQLRFGIVISPQVFSDY